MLPCLPRNDPDPASRRSRLARTRRDYSFARAYDNDDWENGVAVARNVQPTDEFDLAYQAQVMKVDLALLRNHAAVDFERVVSGEATSISLTDLLGLTRQIGNKHRMFSTPNIKASRIGQSFPTNLHAYSEFYATIAAPELVGIYDRGTAEIDRAFAWQRVAGANPYILRGLRHLPSADPDNWSGPDPFDGVVAPPKPGHFPPNFGISDAQFRKAIRDPGDSLDRAVAERRLYATDYWMLQNIPLSEYSDGLLGIKRRRYTYPAFALFCRKRSVDGVAGELCPVAIQCRPQKWDDNAKIDAGPIFLPNGRVHWQMARTVVNNADGVIQEMVYHLGRSHLVMEATILSAENSLAPNHPLKVLLDPHFRFTLALNDYATKNLVAPGGQVEQTFAPTLTGSLKLMTRGMATFDFARAAPPRDIEDRMVDDVGGLPDYPWRDDGALVWESLHRFIRRYIELYYGSDEDVASDPEVSAFFEMLFDPDHGNVPTSRSEVETIEELAIAIATIIWIATAQHSCMNYAQFPMMSYAPNLPGALYAPAPDAESDMGLSHDNWLMMLPPSHLAFVQFTILYQLSAVQTSTLGKYAPLTFLDRRVAPILADFQSELASAEDQIVERDRHRLLSYPFLRPSRIGQSIFI